MSRLSRADQLLIDRFLDGELSASARDRFERRIAAEPALQSAVAFARERTQMIREADPFGSSGAMVPVGFAAGVLDQVRSMPPREELLRMTSDEIRVAEVVVLARRLLVAAVILAGVALLLGMKAFVPPEPDALRASAGQEALEKLDARSTRLKTEELRRRRRGQ